MISHALRTDIESWAGRKHQNPMFKMAYAGTLTKGMITRYIANVTYMIRHTPGHLRRACEEARQRGDLKLAAHYDHKIEEEVGHAVWGDADLESLTKMATAAPSNTTATPSIEMLAAYLTEIIADEPALYLGYLAFTEYVTVLLGPELLALIEERCDVPKTSMTVIDNHIELDREHAEEGFGVIDDLVGDPKMLGPMRKALAGMLERFDGFCLEVTTNVAADDRSSKQVSAA